MEKRIPTYLQPQPNNRTQHSINSFSLTTGNKGSTPPRLVPCIAFFAQRTYIDTYIRSPSLPKKPARLPLSISTFTKANIKLQNRYRIRVLAKSEPLPQPPGLRPNNSIPFSSTTIGNQIEVPHCLVHSLSLSRKNTGKHPSHLPSIMSMKTNIMI
jgi:hypothetical protein